MTTAVPRVLSRSVDVEPVLPSPWRDPLAVVYLWILAAFLLPGYLRFAPLGAFGQPATFLSLTAVVVYLLGLLRPGALMSGGRQPVRWAVLAFAAAALFGYGVALMNTSLIPAEEASSLRTVVSIAGYVGLSLVTLDGIRGRRHLERLLSVVVTGASAMALMGVVQFITGTGPASYIKVPGLVLRDTDINTSRSMFDRVQSTASHPIEYSVVLAIVLPIALHLALHGIGGRPPSRWRWIPVAAIAVGVPVAVSRSAVIGVAVAGVVMAASWSGRRRLNTLAAAAIMLVAMRVAFPGLLGTIKSMFLWVEDDPSIEGRTNDYPLVWEFFRASPIIGRGLGTLVPTVHFYLDNEYLGWLIGGGIVGVAALTGVFFVGMGTARGVYHHASASVDRSIGQALTAATAVSTLTWLTYDGLAFRLNAGTAFILIGATGALWRLSVDRFHWGRGVDRSLPAVPWDKPGGFWEDPIPTRRNPLRRMGAPP